MKIKKYVKIFGYIFLPIILILLNIFANIKEIYPIFGNIALFLIVITLFIKPISLILPSIKIFTEIRRYRREMGISTFYFALSHFIGFLTANNFSKEWMNYISFSNGLIYGIFALSILVILFLTSNNLSVRKLKKNWKKIQRIAYIALLLILVHIALINPENILLAFTLFITYIILKILEIKKITFTKNT